MQLKIRDLLQALFLLHWKIEKYSLTMFALPGSVPGFCNTASTR